MPLGCNHIRQNAELPFNANEQDSVNERRLELNNFCKTNLFVDRKSFHAGLFFTLSLTLSKGERTLNYSPPSGEGLGERVRHHFPQNKLLIFTLDKPNKIVNNITTGWQLAKLAGYSEKSKWLLSVKVRAAFYYVQNQKKHNQA